MTDSTEKKALDLISGLVSLAFPSIAGPAQAVRLLVEDALGVAHEITEDGVSVVQEREQEAGRSISKASEQADAAKRELLKEAAIRIHGRAMQLLGVVRAIEETIGEKIDE